MWEVYMLTFCSKSFSDIFLNKSFVFLNILPITMANADVGTEMLAIQAYINLHTLDNDLLEKRTIKTLP